MQKPITHLMFDGKAEEAMNLYVSLFPKSEIISIIHNTTSGNEGKVLKASFLLNGQEFICIDSPVKHDFTFTAATSIFVNCDTVEEVEKLFGELSKGGKIFMPLSSYPFSEKFGWVADCFGVSWQLNLKRPVSNQ